ncbi:MAG TPA: plasmid pRiA4b ORF-3 family protein [Candidatus Baltobacteraceae bacterium]|nr:plasmid pRiA4b ORF-3 family protein [Candidatus Baltobacteraceae bacterium]
MTHVHVLKIQLAVVKPIVWRRIEIESDAKLPLVSRALLYAMGWTDTHLHAFRIGQAEFGVPDPDFASDMINERRITLAQIAPKPKDRFIFDYDFGDGWSHRVTVEKIIESADYTAPRCVAGARACPPEDCGGPYGYAELIEALADPAHEEHERLTQWMPDDFDPMAFDLEDANVLLRDLRRPRLRAV